MPESRSDLALAAALRVMTPLAEMLMREGVTCPRFANALKKTFLDAAPSVLNSSGSKVTDSSVSTLTGVHRKDVRQWREMGQPKPDARTLNVVMEVFTRWAGDADYCDKKGGPRALERVGGAGTFEALATAVSKDVHPQTLLQELLRLGVVERVKAKPNDSVDKYRLRVNAFVPPAGSAELLQLFADNVADHLAAASSNVRQTKPPMLEQSVYADSLSPKSVMAMNDLARQIWMKAFHEIVPEATALREQDHGLGDADQRIRIGMYMYQGPNAKA